MRLNTVNCKEKVFFRNNYFGSQSFFTSCHFTKIFVDLLTIAAVSNFNIFKLVGWDPVNTYLFQVNKRSTIKKVINMFKVNNKDSKTPF